MKIERIEHHLALYGSFLAESEGERWERRKMMGQREFMRNLFKRHGDNRDFLVKKYAEAEENGSVPRKSNTHGVTPLQYAAALYNDGKRKKWITQE